MAVVLSVVVPTFNRAALIPESISALMNQRWEHDGDYEVIFVNNGSSDDTSEVLLAAVKRYGPRFRFREISASGGPAAPRNEGIRSARGEIVVILDDDVIADDTLLASHARYHSEHVALEACAIGVAYVPQAMKGKAVSLFHEFNYHRIPSGIDLPYTNFWTCNVSFKREFMLRQGMFDERFLYNEDIILGHRLDAAGMRLRLDTSARGQHLHQLRLEDVEKKGRFIGFWIWATAETLPEKAILDYYGVLSWKLGLLQFLRRCANRGGLWLLSNPVSLAILAGLGGRAEERSRLTDLYNYVRHRRAILQGYRHARCAARRQRAREHRELHATDIARELQLRAIAS